MTVKAQTNDKPVHQRISEDQAAELADMFRLMADPSRLRITLFCLDAPKSVGVVADALGLSDAECVFVAHPIQDATDDEMRAKADAVIDQVIAALT